MQLTTLSNGLQVATRAMPAVETISIGLYVDAGSRNERGDEHGLAHLFEHMVFKGAGVRSAREIAEAIEDVGGDINAATGRDSTLFTARLLAEHMPLGLEIIGDLIQRPHFEARALEREKRVVLQELGEARESLGDMVFDNLYATVFSEQALGRTILGDEASLARFDVDSLRRWSARHYVPSGMRVVAAGKVDHDEVVGLAEAQFGARAALAPPAVVRARYSRGTHADARASEQTHIALGAPAPAARAPDYFAARLFAEAVGGGMSSRLFQDLREERGLAYSVYAGVQPFEDVGLFFAYVAAEPALADEAVQRMLSVLREAPGTLSHREIERARAMVKSGLLMSLETPEGQAGYMARLLSLYGRLVAPAELVAEIDAVSADAVHAAGQRLLADSFSQASTGASAGALAA